MGEYLPCCPDATLGGETVLMAVLAVTIVFACLITAYRFFVIRENKRLDAGGNEAVRTMRHGVTQEQLDMGWRYVGYNKLVGGRPE